MQKRGLMYMNNIKFKPIYISGTLSRRKSPEMDLFLCVFWENAILKDKILMPIDMGFSLMQNDKHGHLTILIWDTSQAWPFSIFTNLFQNKTFAFSLLFGHIPFIYFDKHVWSAYYVIATVHHVGDNVKHCAEENILFPILVWGDSW